MVLRKCLDREREKSAKLPSKPEGRMDSRYYTTSTIYSQDIKRRFSQYKSSYFERFKERDTSIETYGLSSFTILWYSIKLHKPLQKGSDPIKTFPQP